MIFDILFFVVGGVLGFIISALPVGGATPNAAILAINWVIQQAYKFNWVIPVDTLLLVLVQVFLLQWSLLTFRFMLWAFRGMWSFGKSM